MKTKVIYINESDRPKNQNPLDFVEWCIKENKSFRFITKRDSDRTYEFGYIDEPTDFNLLVSNYINYRQSFKAEKKGIEFTHWLDDGNLWQSSDIKPELWNFIIVINPTAFVAFDESGIAYRYKGHLNNGRV